MKAKFGILSIGCVFLSLVSFLFFFFEAMADIHADAFVVYSWLTLFLLSVLTGFAFGIVSLRKNEKPRWLSIIGFLPFIIVVYGLLTAEWK